MRHRFIVGDVIYRNDFNLRMIQKQPEEVSTDAAKAVDCEFYFLVSVQGLGKRG